MAEWQDIASAPELERVWVAGWQPATRLVQGYWWWHEDVVERGRAVEHPGATIWCPIVMPDFPTPPETNA